MYVYLVYRVYHPGQLTVEEILVYHVYHNYGTILVNSSGEERLVYHVYHAGQLSG